ncbi:MAG: serine hydrolase domain-containing protein [Polyangiaceae bacterium]
MRFSLLVAPGLLALASVVLVACPTVKPLPGGPPPVYEPPRTIPGDSASPAGSSAVDMGTEDAPFGEVSSLTRAIDTYMSGYGAKWGEAYAPSGVLAVAYGGKVVFTRTYGKADRRSNAEPDAATQFRIGSLTKMFTAASVMKLVEKGTVKLDDPITKYVSELPEAYKDVTLTRLLHQTAGVPSYTDDPAMLRRKAEDVPVADVLAWIAKQPLAFKPGSSWAYSNSNYYLLGVVVERASKSTLEAFMKTSIFEPAGMFNSSVKPGTGPVAKGYMISPADKLVDADAVSPAVPFGAGYLYASVNDLVAWDRALEGTKVLSKESKASLFSVDNDKNYGMGWIVQKKGGTEIEWHNGAIDGFGAYFGRSPDKHVAVVFLSNTFQFDATQVGQDVMGMALGGPAVKPIAEREFEVMDLAYGTSIAGDYKLTPEAEKAASDKGVPRAVLDTVMGFTIAYDSGTLTATPNGQSAVSLHKGKDGVLFNGAMGVDVTAQFGDGGKATGLTLKQGGLSLSYVRGKYSPPPPLDPKTPPKGAPVSKK